MGYQRTGNAKVTPQLVAEIRRLYEEGLSQPELARRFGIGPAQVGRIVRGEAWVNVTQGIGVVSRDEALARGMELSTPQGQSFMRNELQGIMERALKVQEEMKAAAAVAPPVINEEASRAADARYRRLMGLAENEADAMEPLVTEAGAAALEKLTSESAAHINAGKLLEELKIDSGADGAGSNNTGDSQDENQSR